MDAGLDESWLPSIEHESEKTYGGFLPLRSSSPPRGDRGLRGGKNLDTAKVEQDLRSHADAGVESKAECPDEVEDIKSQTYECAHLRGQREQQAVVQMKIGDNDESVFANEDAASGELAIRGIVAQSDEDPATVCEHLRGRPQASWRRRCPTQVPRPTTASPRSSRAASSRARPRSTDRSRRRRRDRRGRQLDRHRHPVHAACRTGGRAFRPGVRAPDRATRRVVSGPHGHLQGPRASRILQLEALKHLGYDQPTPIQEQTIPLLLEGRDVIGQARPGRARPLRSACR